MVRKFFREMLDSIDSMRNNKRELIPFYGYSIGFNNPLRRTLPGAIPFLIYHTFVTNLPLLYGMDKAFYVLEQLTR